MKIVNTQSEFVERCCLYLCGFAKAARFPCCLLCCKVTQVSDLNTTLLLRSSFVFAVNPRHVSFHSFPVAQCVRIARVSNFIIDNRKLFYAFIASTQKCAEHVT